MKKLTNASDLMESWAHQDRAGGVHNNVSFDGPRLFSYDTPVAAIMTRTVDAHAPLRICLTTYRRHSATTSGHIAQARTAAAQAGLTSIGVATIESPLDHQRNLIGLAEDAIACFRRANRARVYADSQRMRGRKRVLELNLYSKFFGLGYHAAPNAENVDVRMEDLIGQLQQMESV